MTARMRHRFFGLLTLGLFLVFPAAAEEEDYFQVTTLAPDLMLVTTDQGSYSNNSLVFTGDDGLLLVDTHHDADADEFKKFIDGLGYGAPKYIISTHRHQEHIGGNHLWGPDPVIVSHKLMPEKMRSGTYLFNAYAPEAFPDKTFDDTMEIRFNGELIHLTTIGGSHDDNEILVHFTNHRIAHISSVVNGFNFPSVDGDGDVLQFEVLARRLMTLLPQDVRLISGHNGKAQGFDFVGSWDMLEPYAEMMKNTVAIVQKGLDEGKTQEQMQEEKVLAEYDEYAGSYVSASGWIEYVVDALTVPRETREDICKPVHATWEKDGAGAAVNLYRELLKTDEDKYDFSEFVLLSIGSKLYTRELYDDALEFLLGSLEMYPDAKYGYYTNYLAARCYHKQDQPELAEKYCRESVRQNSDFEQAATLLEELTK